MIALQCRGYEIGNRQLSPAVSLMRAISNFPEPSIALPETLVFPPPGFPFAHGPEWVWRHRSKTREPSHVTSMFCAGSNPVEPDQSVGFILKENRIVGGLIRAKPLASWRSASPPPKGTGRATKPLAR